MNPASVRSKVRKNERFPHPDGERHAVDDPACTAVYDQVFSNELHSDVIP